MSKYVLDACALLAVLNDEVGGESVSKLIEQADDGSVIVRMNIVNLLEVYYGILREVGKEEAESILLDINASSIEIIDTISEPVFKEAGRLKATYKVSLADSFALAEASVLGYELLTSDHHEFDVIEQSEDEDIIFRWVR